MSDHSRTDTMPHFVLIDHSITKVGGHHYEYAAHVLTAAAAAGYTPVLATNRQFGAAVSASWVVHPVYAYGYWLYLSFPLLYRWFQRLSMPHSLNVQSTTDRSSGSPLQRARRLGSQFIHWGYDRIRRRGFARDTRRLFLSIQSESRDLVFIPTLSHVELLGLRDYFRQQSRSTKAAWHLLFRRDLPSTYPQADEVLKSIWGAFLQFRDECTRQKVYFYTDTDELADQYSRLGIVRFRTLPIPHTRLLAGRQRMPGQPLHIVYMGDARAEKGYQYLPWLVRDLWADYVETGQVRFVFQSYYPAPEGEPTVSAARSELQQYPSDKVRLITEPVSSEEYWRVLEEGDIVLLLYNRDNYAARSSGILVEALAAGKPVIVPAGTWMARQVQSAEHRWPVPSTRNGVRGAVGLIYRDIQEVPSLLRRLIGHYADYSENARAFARLWHEKHNAARLVAILQEISGHERTFEDDL